MPDIPDNEEDIVCIHCGTRHAIDESHDIGGDPHCPDCVERCEECDREEVIASGVIYPARTSYHTSGDNQAALCEDCCFVCADCGHRFSCSLQYFSNDSDRRICESCAEEYRSCDSCGDMHHGENLAYDEESEQDLCESCRESAASRTLHDYGYRPSPRFSYGKGERQIRNASLFAGVEIEVDNGGSVTQAIKSSGLDHHDNFYCKHDGSLNEGFEIVSHPATWQWWKEHDFKWTGLVQKEGFRSYNTTTCGMHVHVSRSWFKPLDILKLLTFFRDNEDFILRMSRRGSKKKLNEWSGVDKAARCKHIRMVKREQSSDSGRYCALNLEPDRTIEFRLFRGTLHVPSIRRNLAWVFALCHFVKHAGLNDMTEDNFRDWIVEHGKSCIGRVMGRMRSLCITESNLLV